MTAAFHGCRWPTAYGRTKPAPPCDTPEARAFRGSDILTLREPVCGAGSFAKRSTFLENSTIAPAVGRGRGGRSVFDPPHLLSYADANHDDGPDGPPAVHPEDFKLEDTHSIANSLRQGPDGWPYRAIGSTVTADIARPGVERAPVTHLSRQACGKERSSTRLSSSPPPRR